MGHLHILDSPVHRRVITLLYFFFTTVSTVGFGDFYPINAFEKTMFVIIMFGGVAIFTIIFDNLNSFLQSFHVLYADFDQRNELDQFLGVMAGFNNK